MKLLYSINRIRLILGSISCLLSKYYEVAFTSFKASQESLAVTEKIYNIPMDALLGISEDEAFLSNDKQVKFSRRHRD